MDLLLCLNHRGSEEDSVCFNVSQTSYLCYYNAFEASLRGCKYTPVGTCELLLSILAFVSLTLPQLSQHSI